MWFEFPIVSAGITGFESPALDYQDMKMLLDDVLIEKKVATFIAVVSGQSMTEFGIFDGDLLIVERGAKKRDLDIIVGILNGEFVCKQIDRQKAMLYSGNEKYRPVKINEHDNFIEEGVVIRSIRLFRKPSVMHSFQV